MKAVGIKCDYGEPAEKGEYRGTHTTVGDQEHAEIIRLYVEGLSMHGVSRELGRSTKTVKDHLDDHDRSVERSAFCPACRRVRSDLESQIAKRK